MTSLESAAQAMREAMRETVKRHSLWYLVQSALMILGGILALFYPILSSFAVVLFLGWVLIISGVVQGISLIGAQHVPHFWLQLVSVVLSVIVGLLSYCQRKNDFRDALDHEEYDEQKREATGRLAQSTHVVVDRDVANRSRQNLAVPARRCSEHDIATRKGMTDGRHQPRLAAQNVEA
jgi:hypothetical protein